MHANDAQNVSLTPFAREFSPQKVCANLRRPASAVEMTTLHANAIRWQNAAGPKSIVQVVNYLHFCPWITLCWQVITSSGFNEGSDFPGPASNPTLLRISP